MFPNDSDTDDRLVAGRERVVPSLNGDAIVTTPTQGDGLERIYVVATTGAQPVFPPGTKKGQFTFYSNDADREKLVSTVRGLVLQKKKAGEPLPGDGEVSDRERLFRVQK